MPEKTKMEMESNNLICSEDIIKEIADDSYYKVKNKLLNILVNCKMNQNNMEELEELIGLDEVKQQLKKIINYIKVSKNREKQEMIDKSLWIIYV